MSLSGTQYQYWERGMSSYSFYNMESSMLYVRKFIITMIIKINEQLQKPFAKRTTACKETNKRCGQHRPLT